MKLHQPSVEQHRGILYLREEEPSAKIIINRHIFLKVQSYCPINKGTAPERILEHNNKIFIILPGPPRGDCSNNV